MAGLDTCTIQVYNNIGDVNLANWPYIVSCIIQLKLAHYLYMEIRLNLARILSNY